MKINGKTVRGVALFRRQVRFPEEQSSDLMDHMLVFADDFHLRYGKPNAVVGQAVKQLVRLSVGTACSGEFDMGWRTPSFFFHLHDYPGEGIENAMRARGYSKTSWEKAPMWVRKALRKVLAGYKPPKKVQARRDERFREAQA